MGDVRTFWLLLLIVVPTLAFAEDAKAKAAREELERQLQGMMGSVPTKVRIDYAEITDPNYELQEATFELDGKALLTPPPGALALADEKILVWQGDTSPGKHVVRVKLRYKNIASVVMSNEGGHEWTLTGDRSFEQQSGIEVRVLVKTSIDTKVTSIEKRLVLSLPAQPVMIAKLDDGTVPAPPPKAVVDAGPSAEEIAAAKKAADEAEKKRLADEAAAAKLAADEEKKRKAEELASAKLAADEEKKRKAEEAKLAREGSPRPAVAETAKPVEPEPTPVAVAPEPVAEPVDAGPAPVAVVAPEPVDAGVALAPEAPPEEGEFPWLLVAIGGAAAFILLIVLARRRSRPPTLDE